MSSWNASGYEQHHSYVWRHGEDLIELLAPQPGERILDLGCGPGQLTALLAASGAHVVGLDQDGNMLAQAREHYPNIEFVQANAADFVLSEPFDAVFSNAALHWMKEQAAVIENVARALKPGGRFVAEMGGNGNISRIVRAILDTLEAIDQPPPSVDSYPWYFPSTAGQSFLLEFAGFDVQAMWHFARPTQLDGGDAGMANWLSVFGVRLLEHLSVSQYAEAVRMIEDILRPELYKDGVWSVDYVRLRFVAVKLEV